MAADDTLHLKQAAVVVGLAPLTLRFKAVYCRQVAYHKVGKRLVFLRGDLDAYLASCRMPARTD